MRPESVLQLHSRFRRGLHVNAKLSGCGVLFVALTVTTGTTTGYTASSSSPFGGDGAARQSKPGTATKRDAKPQGRRAAHQDYQVPAGTLLFIDLRTPIRSDSSQRSDAIRGVLKSALTSDGVELVPSGAVVLGTVTEAEPALHARDFARVAFRFNVLEHPLTGSRVPIRTETRALEVDAGKMNRAAEGAAAFNQIRLEPGTEVSMSLREPFLVRIPEK
jgi:hypothetical protein